MCSVKCGKLGILRLWEHFCSLQEFYFVQLQQTCYNSTCHSASSVVKLLMINFYFYLHVSLNHVGDIHKVTMGNKILILTPFHGNRILKYHAIKPIESLVSHHWRSVTGVGEGRTLIVPVPNSLFSAAVDPK